jgi:hypothetical protein
VLIMIIRVIESNSKKIIEYREISYLKIRIYINN